MAKAFIFMMCPVGIAVALIQRYARAVPAGPAVRDDVPERLLRWAAGLLSALGAGRCGGVGDGRGRGRCRRRVRLCDSPVPAGRR
jgi:hypothetical protein